MNEWERVRSYVFVVGIERQQIRCIRARMSPKLDWNLRPDRLDQHARHLREITVRPALVPVDKLADRFGGDAKQQRVSFADDRLVHYRRRVHDEHFGIVLVILLFLKLNFLSRRTRHFLKYTHVDILSALT